MLWKYSIFVEVDTCNFPVAKVTSPKLLEVLPMKTIPEAMRAYLENPPFDPCDDDCATVLDQIYLAYANSHESDPPEIQAGFAELETFLESLPLSDNNAAFNLCCRLCSHYEEKAFKDGLLYGAHLIMELTQNADE